ncbi:MAG: NADH-quinone oxidoreductase subunit NuoB [Acidiferrobacteraceae bacterium]
MPVWTLFGLQRGKATIDWPFAGDQDGQEGLCGMPRHDPARCAPDCEACAVACLPGAIRIDPGLARTVQVDYGRCIVCQLCIEACPEGAFTRSSDWAFGVRRRDDLVWQEALASEPGRQLPGKIQKVFGRSLHVRHVDAGSCNGCESELQALNNPFYNLHRLGIFFTASPRAADLLLVTGPITYAMRGPLLEAYRAMPEPHWVMAMGTCAVSGGVVADGYACGRGLDGVLPVDLYLPGCPPNPAAMIDALLMLLGRAPQRVQGGHLGN